MKRLVTACAVVAAATAPAATAVAAPTNTDAKNASKECKELRAADPQAFKDKYNNLGKCVSEKFGKCVSANARGDVGQYVEQS